MTGAQLDRIEVTGIRGWGHHGVLAAEKELGQEFSADVTLWLSTGPAGRADRLSRTVNYADVVADVHAEISTGSHDLLETLAERIAARILSGVGDPLVRRVDVVVHKPAAPVGLPVGDVRLAISREGAQVSAVLALGSNLGDRGGYLARALERLTAEPGIDVSWTGTVVETQPGFGPGDQGPFMITMIAEHTSLGTCALIGGGLSH